MITKKQSMIRIIALVTVVMMPALMLFTHCRGDEDVYSKPEVTLSPEGELTFGAQIESKSLTLTTNRSWRVVKEEDSDWFDVAPMEGEAGTSTITVTVKSAPSARENFFTIVSSIVKKEVPITQAGADGSTITYITISELREKYAQSGKEVWTVTEPLKLRAVVISDKENGNNTSLKNGYLEDESGAGIAFRVTDKSHHFNLGDKLNINLRGTEVSQYAGALQLGLSATAAAVESQGAVIEPKELTIEEIEKGMYDAMLVKVKNVQFKEYRDLTYQTGDKATNRMLEDCSNFNLTVRTTQYATFKGGALPAGQGNMTGILSLFNGTWQLFLRNLDDAKEMSDDPSSRCTPVDPPVTGTKISIADLRAALVEGKEYAEDHYVEGEVILNASKKNIADFVVYVADATAGVTFTFGDADNVLAKMPLGATVKVNVKGAKHTLYNGLLQIGDKGSLTTRKVELVEKVAATPLKPRVVTIDEINEGKYMSELVQVNDVQFEDPSKTYSGSQKIVNAQAESAVVFTNKNATFADEKVKELSGAFIGVVSIFKTPQLLIRSVKDLEGMNKPRFAGKFIETDKPSLTFEKEGASQTVEVTSNVKWTASADQQWVTVTPANGENNGMLTVTVAANSGEQRTATVTITDGTLSKTVSITQAGEGGGGTVVATDLFFSEYIEGSSNNKYLEIYNGTGKEVDLSDYKVLLFTNGGKDPKNSEQLSGTLANGAVLIIKNANAALYTGSAMSIESTVTYYNGDDALAILKNSTGKYVDIFGCIGEDPGDAWIDANDNTLTTKKRTLVRKPSVGGGVTTNPETGFPTLSTEWISYPVNTIDDLGKHKME